VNDQPQPQPQTRRVGKSYLLYQLMDEIKKIHPKASVIYINMEDYAFRDVLTWKDHKKGKRKKAKGKRQKVEGERKILNYSIKMQL
jgi:predicted AAA+ superfamily ATPase